MQLTASNLDSFLLLSLFVCAECVDIHAPFIPHLPLVGLPPHMNYHFGVVRDVDGNLFHTSVRMYSFGITGDVPSGGRISGTN
jgi:hypothetical protein